MTLSSMSERTGQPAGLSLRKWLEHGSGTRQGAV